MILFYKFMILSTSYTFYKKLLLCYLDLKQRMFTKLFNCLFFIILSDFMLCYPTEGENELFTREKSWIQKLGYCIQHKDCKGNEYCDYRKKDWNVCRPKGDDGDYCMINFRCLSGYCVGFKCRGSKHSPNDPMNGRCEHDYDCHKTQHCSKRKCIDRKHQGFCATDTQCLSNLCEFFRCRTPWLPHLF
jgi:hypothetical protein